MDPLSVSLAIAPLVLSSAKIVAGVRSVRHKYKNAQSAAANTQTECEFMHVALCEVQALIQKNNLQATVRLQSQDSVGETFDKVLTGCRITLDALTLELDGVLKITKGAASNSDEMGRRSKIEYLWKKETMEELMGQMKDQRNYIQFLITILQSDTQAEILKLIQENAQSIHKLLNKAKSIRSMQGFDDTGSIFTTVRSITEDPLGASYEEQLHQSPAYRKAQAAAAEDLLAAKLELLEEKYNLEETVDRLTTEMTSKDDAIQERDKLIDEKDRLIDEKDRLTDEKDRLIEERSREIDTITHRNSLKTLRIEALREEIGLIKASSVILKKNPNKQVLEDEEGSILDELKENGFTWMSVWAFNWAATNGKVGPFRLGEYNASFKDPVTGMNYLHAASAHGHVHLVKYLLSKKIGDHLSENSTLDQSNHREIEKCFAVDERTSGVTGLTALQIASQEGHFEVVVALWSSGADVNAPGEGLKGQTALQAAAGNGHIDIVHYLLDVRADVRTLSTASRFASSPKSQTNTNSLGSYDDQPWCLPAIEAAEAGGYSAIVELLKSRYALQESYFPKSAYSERDLEHVKSLWAQNSGFPKRSRVKLAIIKGDTDLLRETLRLKFSTCSFRLFNLDDGHVNSKLIRDLLSASSMANHSPISKTVKLTAAVVGGDTLVVDELLREEHLFCNEDNPTVLDLAVILGYIPVMKSLLASAFEYDLNHYDCSSAYENAMWSTKLHAQRETLQSVLMNSDFGKCKGRRRASQSPIADESEDMPA